MKAISFIVASLLGGHALAAEPPADLPVDSPATVQEEPVGVEPAIPPAAPAAPAVQAIDFRISTTGGGLTITQGNSKFQLGGRLQFVAAAFDSDATDFDSGTDLRRARLQVKGTIDPKWRFKFEYDFRDQQIKDAFVTWLGWSAGAFSFGQVFPPVSMENYTSSRWITFVERSLPNALVPDRELGFAFDRVSGNWVTQASLTWDNIHADDSGGDRPTLLGRWVWSPLHDAGRVWHWGASLAHVQADRTETVKLSSRPEVKLDATARPVAVSVGGADGHYLGGLEALWLRGANSIQSEVVAVKLHGTPADDPLFYGWYVYGSHVFGGQRSYDAASGSFERSATADGAWEIALRYSGLDLSDGSHRGGVERNATLGLNWYPNRSVRVFLNAIHAVVDGGVNGDEEFQVLLMQGQLAF